MLKHPISKGGLVLLLAVTSVGLSACGGPSAQNTSASESRPELFNELPKSVQDAGKVRVATISDFPPAEYKDASGKLAGYEIELGYALGKALGVEVEFQPSAFASILTGVEAGRFDFALTSLTDTVEREKQADMVNYLNSGLSLLVPEDNPLGATETLTTMCGARMAVVRGTLQESLLTEFSNTNCSSKPMVFSVFDSVPEGILQVQTDRADGYVTDALGAPYTVEQANAKGGGKIKFIDLPQFKLNPNGIPVAKNNTEMRDALVKGIESLKNSGEYEAILKKHGIEKWAVDKVTVNAASEH